MIGAFRSFINHQITLIWRGGWPVIVDRVRLGIGRIFDYFGAILAVPLVIVIRLLRPIVVIRFGPMRSNRIGHFTGQYEIYLCERDQGLHGKRTVDLFYFMTGVCNRQLAKMWQRTVVVTFFAHWADTINSLIPGGGHHKVPLRMEAADYDIHGLTADTPPHLSFNLLEQKRGRNSLRELAVPEGGEFVCLAARDTAYLQETFPTIDWRYHDYRNSTISNYLAAAAEMVDRGYCAIRMGAVTNIELNAENPRIIDYASSGSRSDFLDIYLAGNCRIFVGSSDGIIGIPLVFRRPIVMVNFVPLGDIWNWNPDFLCIPKKMWLRQERRFLSFREISESEIYSFHRSEQFDRLGIDVVENTPEEIAAVVIEMDDRLNGEWQTTKMDEELQEQFWSVHKSAFQVDEIRSRIGAEYLRQNVELLA